MMLADWGESVQFRTGEAGTPRAIDVLITRHQPDPIPGVPASFAPFADVWIKNHATEGASSLNLGKDSLYFPSTKGGTSKWWDINELVDQESGFWHVRIRTAG